MKWDLNEEWVRRARDATMLGHEGHGLHGWMWQSEAGGPLLAMCKCRTYLCIPGWAMERQARWHDEDEKRDLARENPPAIARALCAHGVPTSVACQECCFVKDLRERNAELEDEVATLRAKVAELESRPSHPVYRVEPSPGQRSEVRERLHARLKWWKGKLTEPTQPSAVASAPAARPRGVVIRCQGYDD